jgi:hypothetical protein
MKKDGTSATVRRPRTTVPAAISSVARSIDRRAARSPARASATRTARADPRRARRARRAPAAAPPPSRRAPSLAASVLTPTHPPSPHLPPPHLSTPTGQEAQPQVRAGGRQALGVPGLRIHLRRLPRAVGRDEAVPRVRRAQVRAQDPGGDEHRHRIHRRGRPLRRRPLPPRQARVMWDGLVSIDDGHRRAKNGGDENTHHPLLIGPSSRPVSLDSRLHPRKKSIERRPRRAWSHFIPSPGPNSAGALFGSSFPFSLRLSNISSALRIAWSMLKYL